MDNQAKIEAIANHYHWIMQTLGIDLESPHAKDTPMRVAKMLVNETFRSLTEPPPEITTFPNDSPGFVPAIIRDIEFHSTCAHHHLPFYGTADIAYLADERLAGLSKFHRTVEYFSALPQVQEKLTQDIIDYLNPIIEPRWMGIRLRATHMCVNCRGVKNGGTTTTYALADNVNGGRVDLVQFIQILNG